jgi:hypothetical protein
MEQLKLLHARMDDKARTLLELLRRDALRDHPVAISTTATPHVDAHSGSIANSCLLRNPSIHTVATLVVGTRSTRSLSP